MVPLRQNAHHYSVSVNIIIVPIRAKCTYSISVKTGGTNAATCIFIIGKTEVTDATKCVVNAGKLSDGTNAAKCTSLFSIGKLYDCTNPAK